MHHTGNKKRFFNDRENILPATGNAAGRKLRADLRHIGRIGLYFYYLFRRISKLVALFFSTMRAFLTIAVLIFLTSLSQSASAQIEGSAVIGYDPLFWKAELRLSTEQCMQLRDINAEFYKAILSAARDHAKWDADRLRIVELLNSRSEKIMQIFTGRQRKKWDKIASAYRGNIVAKADTAPAMHWARN